MNTAERHILTLLLSGTRGDVQPLLALAQGCKAAGLHVRIATHARYHMDVTATGLEFVLLDGDPYDLLYHPAYAGALTIGAGLRGLLATWRYLRAVQPVYARMAASAAAHCRTSDAILVSLPTFWGRALAAAHEVACMQAFLQPITPTAAFPCVFLPDSRPRSAAFNRISHALFDRILHNTWHTAVQKGAGVHMPRQAAIADSHTPAIYGFSSHVIAAPPDWPQDHRITGYWFEVPTSNWHAPPDLTAFLRSGTPPVYIGFGSLLPNLPTRFLQAVLDAFQQTGLRGMLALTNPPPNLPPSVIAVGNVPHHWLFPQLAAVVHHGGAGTAAAGLRAGVPTIIVPVGVDNAFWGQHIHDLGAGPLPIPLAQLNAARLASALRAVVDEPRYRTNAAMLRERIQAENGIIAGVERIRTLLG